MKKHELLIHCFDKWWKASSYEESPFKVMKHQIEVIISPAITYTAKIVYDKTDKKFIKNATGTSADQVLMEIWVLNNDLPELPLKRKPFERLRRHYIRDKALEIKETMEKEDK